MAALLPFKQTGQGSIPWRGTHAQKHIYGGGSCLICVKNYGVMTVPIFVCCNGPPRAKDVDSKVTHND